MITHPTWLKIRSSGFTIVTGFALHLGCTSSSPVVPTLPKPDDVQEIEVRIFDPFSDGEVHRDFSLPSEQIPATLRLFKPPVYEELPPEKFLEDVAMLRIFRKDKQVHEMRVVFFGKEPARFVFDGIPCMRGGLYRPVSVEDIGDDTYELYSAESMAIYSYLKALDAGDTDKVERTMVNLEKSSGRKP